LSIRFKLKKLQHGNYNKNNGNSLNNTEQISYADFLSTLGLGCKPIFNIGECREFQGGLVFQVNGLTHKGWVRVI
jgi:hypothetical protein